jgi:hypothetical protein
MSFQAMDWSLGNFCYQRAILGKLSDNVSQEQERFYAQILESEPVLLQVYTLRII